MEVEAETGVAVAGVVVIDCGGGAGAICIGGITMRTITGGGCTYLYTPTCTTGGRRKTVGKSIDTLIHRTTTIIVLALSSLPPPPPPPFVVN